MPKKKKDNEPLVIYKSDEEAYKATGNPLHVWDAILHFKNHNYDAYFMMHDPSDPEYIMEPPVFPQWIMEYLAKAAQDLLAIDTPGRQIDVLIKKALGIKGADNFNVMHKDDLFPAHYKKLGLRNSGVGNEVGGVSYNVWNEIMNERKRRKWGNRSEIIVDVAKKFNIGVDKAIELYNKFEEIENAFAKEYGTCDLDFSTIKFERGFGGVETKDKNKNKK